MRKDLRFFSCPDYRRFARTRCTNTLCSAEDGAAGAYPIDIHPASGGELVYQALGEDHALVAGRGISASHEAMAAIRVMTISMAIGQAAGTTAGVCGGVRYCAAGGLAKGWGLFGG